MKLASIIIANGQTMTACQIDVAGQVYLLHLAGVYGRKLGEGDANARLAQALLPSDMRLLLDNGEQSLQSAQAAFDYARDGIASPRDVADWMDAGLLYRPDDVTFLPPIPRPGKVIAIGANYQSHLDEIARKAPPGSRDGDVAANLGQISVPSAFAVLPSTLGGHNGVLSHPHQDEFLDYEAELGFVIGKTCKRVSGKDWLDNVVGFVVANDFSLRHKQLAEMKKGMVMLGKNADGATVLGPYLVTKDEISDGQNLHMTCRVNGELRQDANTSEMIFPMSFILQYFSDEITFEPGDIFITGTPAGVALAAEDPEAQRLKPGDVVEVEINGLGCLKTTIGPVEE